MLVIPNYLIQQLQSGKKEKNFVKSKTFRNYWKGFIKKYKSQYQFYKFCRTFLVCTAMCFICRLIFTNIFRYSFDITFFFKTQEFPWNWFNFFNYSMEGTNGYLSVVDWPLLPFYGLMCGLYVAMGLGWLVVCKKIFFITTY